MVCWHGFAGGSNCALSTTFAAAASHSFQVLRVHTTWMSPALPSLEIMKLKLTSPTGMTLGVGILSKLYSARSTARCGLHGGGDAVATEAFTIASSAVTEEEKAVPTRATQRAATSPFVVSFNVQYASSVRYGTSGSRPRLLVCRSKVRAGSARLACLPPIVRTRPKATFGRGRAYHCSGVPGSEAPSAVGWGLISTPDGHSIWPSGRTVIIKAGFRRS